MTNTNFFKLLLLTIVVSIILSEGILYLLGNWGDRMFSYLSIAFFAVFCQIIYGLAQSAKHSRKPKFFIRLSIANVFIKIVLVFIFVGAYYKLIGPSHRLFIAPFLSTYLVFLIFETYFMFELSEAKKLLK